MGFNSGFKGLKRGFEVIVFRWFAFSGFWLRSNKFPNLRFAVPCIFNHSNKTPNQMQQSVVKFYCFVVHTLLNMFRALLCPSSGARQTAVATSGFRMNVEVVVFSAVVGWEHYHLHIQTETRGCNGSLTGSNARNMLSSVCTTKQ